MPLNDAREYRRRVHEHVRGFFVGHETRARSFDRGPIQRALPGFSGIEVEPGPLLGHPAYVSVGAGRDDEAGAARLEFITVGPEPSERHIELLAMTAHYHRTGERLGVGHTFPLGEAWLTGSSLDHMLVSLPYPFGPKLELFSLDGAEVRILWLLPITAAERAYKKREGLEALESRFESAAIEYWEPTRPSVV